MNIEEWVQCDREKKRQLFGDIGVHEDCIHYGVAMGERFCNACSYWTDSNKYGRNQRILECEKNVCYFYKPKKERTVPND